MTNKNLNLDDLSHFTGTIQYYNVMGFNVTDGINYIMECGYSWFITDFLSLIATNHKGLKSQEFLSINLKLLENKKAKMRVTDGNNNILYEQKYEYTNALKELNLYFTNKVLLLAQEY